MMAFEGMKEMKFPDGFSQDGWPYWDIYPIEEWKASNNYDHRRYRDPDHNNYDHGKMAEQ